MQDSVKVLVVDDEFAITQNLEYALVKNGYAVFTALNGDDGLTLFQRERPSVVILDIKMPGINGLKLLDIFKKETPEVSVIMLTSMGLDCDIERGLDNGADRYLVKDTRPSVVVSNVKAMLRSRQKGLSRDAAVLVHGEYEAVMDGNRLYICKKPLSCTWYEFKLMCALIRHPHYAHKRDHLLDVVYGEEAPTDRSIDQLVKRIRQKAKRAGVLLNPIRTVPTIGYQLGESGEA